VVVTADGTVWTGGIAWSGTSGLARIDGSSCIEVSPLGDARRRDIGGLAAGPAGGLAAVVDDDSQDGQSGRTSVVWFDGTAWSTLLTREVPGGGALAVGPMGEVWFSGRWPEYAIDGMTAGPGSGRRRCLGLADLSGSRRDGLVRGPIRNPADPRRGDPLTKEVH
jgi:hypothetical protein